MAINLLESLPRVSGVSEKLQTKLARLTQWPTRRQHNNQQKHGAHNSVTANAAANEKYLRRSPSSAQFNGIHQRICSEDLTASQFANITGIRIYQSGRCPDFSLSDQKICLATQHSQEDSRHAVRFGPTRSRNLSIWDSDFWNQQQDSDQQRLELHDDKCHVPYEPQHATCQSHQSLNMNPNSTISLQRSISSGQTTYSSLQSSNYTLPVDETPFISSLRHKSTYERRPSVVQKGRFKIELEIGNSDPTTTSDDDSMVSFPESNVVEWKRKRTCSA
ncbi:hypothetical protein CLU79DRAFT_206022 [Phycomyces nitens]|nr:hypothetical protein CLU79DRAFT_206022 [Phycomyces nitens]